MLSSPWYTLGWAVKTIEKDNLILPNSNAGPREKPIETDFEHNYLGLWGIFTNGLAINTWIESLYVELYSPVSTYRCEACYTYNVLQAQQALMLVS